MLHYFVYCSSLKVHHFTLLIKFWQLFAQFRSVCHGIAVSPEDPPLDALHVITGKASFAKAHKRTPERTEDPQYPN